MDAKKNTRSTQLDWLPRILASLLFLVIIYYGFYAIALVTIIQVIHFTILRKANEDLAKLSKPLTDSYVKMVRFCLLLSNDMPQPFKDWFKKL